ncbi:hypothetical protein HDZ31DRAFT_62246 [Schizophyllum fasciatum]
MSFTSTCHPMVSISSLLCEPAPLVKAEPVADALALSLSSAPWRAPNAFRTPSPARSRAPSPASLSRSLKRSRDTEISDDEAEERTIPTKRARSENGNALPPRLERIRTPDLPTSPSGLRAALRAAYEANEALDAANDALFDENTQQRADLVDASLRAKEAEHARARARLEMQLARDKALAAEYRADVAEERTRALEAQLALGAQQMSALRADLTRAEEETEWAWRCAEGTDEDLEETRGLLADADALLEGAFSLISDVEARAEEEHGEHEATRTLLSAVRSERNVARSQRDTLKKERRAVKSEIELLRKDRDALRAERDELCHARAMGRSKADLTVGALLN